MLNTMNQWTKQQCPTTIATESDVDLVAQLDGSFSSSFAMKTLSISITEVKIYKRNRRETKRKVPFMMSEEFLSCDLDLQLQVKKIL